MTIQEYKQLSNKQKDDFGRDLVIEGLSKIHPKIEYDKLDDKYEHYDIYLSAYTSNNETIEYTIECKYLLNNSDKYDNSLIEFDKIGILSKHYLRTKRQTRLIYYYLDDVMKIYDIKTILDLILNNKLNPIIIKCPAESNENKNHKVEKLVYLLPNDICKIIKINKNKEWQ